MSKENDSNSSKSGGIGFCGLLTIVFVTLKLCKVIAWSWLWVLSPIWIPIDLVLCFMLIVVIVGLVASTIDKIQTKRIRKKREQQKELDKLKQ